MIHALVLSFESPLKILWAIDISPCVSSDWLAAMQPHMQQWLLYCELWHITSFTLIKAVCSLYDGIPSVGLYLAGKLSLFFLNVFSVVGDFYFPQITTDMYSTQINTDISQAALFQKCHNLAFIKKSLIVILAYKCSIRCIKMK